MRLNRPTVWCESGFTAQLPQAVTRSRNSVLLSPTMGPALRLSSATASSSRSFPPKRKRAVDWAFGWLVESPINMEAESACAAGLSKDRPGPAWSLPCRREEHPQGQKNEDARAGSICHTIRRWPALLAWIPLRRKRRNAELQSESRSGIPGTSCLSGLPRWQCARHGLSRHSSARS